MAAGPCNADLLRVSSTSACSISATCFRTRTSRLLAFSRELLLVCRLQVRDLRLVRSEIGETRRIVRIAWFIDLVQVELTGMRRHPDVGLVGRLHGESVLEVLNDGGIAGRAQELHARIDAVHIHYQNVVLSAAILNAEAEAVGAR